mmetsp:Transcript_43056/g.84909  ORF Transcript_43056/g.84909 Transcript_43056/m.84909 type:complete len:322 (-) Transcript_43056:624-1589(-)
MNSSQSKGKRMSACGASSSSTSVSTSALPSNSPWKVRTSRPYNSWSDWSRRWLGETSPSSSSSSSSPWLFFLLFLLSDLGRWSTTCTFSNPNSFTWWKSQSGKSSSSSLCISTTLTTRCAELEESFGLGRGGPWWRTSPPSSSSNLLLLLLPLSAVPLSPPSNRSTSTSLTPLSQPWSDLPATVLLLEEEAPPAAPTAAGGGEGRNHTPASAAATRFPKFLSRDTRNDPPTRPHQEATADKLPLGATRLKWAGAAVATSPAASRLATTPSSSTVLVGSGEEELLLRRLPHLGSINPTASPSAAAAAPAAAVRFGLVWSLRE